MIRIGVTGTFCAGKDSFAKYLVEEKGFSHISLSDIIREELKVRGVEATRESLRVIGNEMREKEGSAVLAKRALARMKKDKDYVITSIRNPLEVKELAGAGRFVLVAVDAQRETRFQRMMSRGRKESEPSTFEEFCIAEDKEMVSHEQGQNIKNCMEMAKFIITNDEHEEQLKKKIDLLLPEAELSLMHKRPSWDEYFNQLRDIVGKRGTCDRGRSGCVIVKDKRVISTGYVGSPPGMAHCDELGHWFKRVIHEDGKITQHCIRTVHAEANAIAQAARHGTPLDGATLYCTMEPCIDCTKLLISAGIKRVVCWKKYHAAEETREMLEEAGVKLEVINEEFEEYLGQK